LTLIASYPALAGGRRCLPRAPARSREGVASCAQSVVAALSAARPHVASTETSTPHAEMAGDRTAAPLDRVGGDGRGARSTRARWHHRCVASETSSWWGGVGGAAAVSSSRCEAAGPAIEVTDEHRVGQLQVRLTGFLQASLSTAMSLIWLPREVAQRIPPSRSAWRGCRGASSVGHRETELGPLAQPELPQPAVLRLDELGPHRVQGPLAGPGAGGQ